MKVINWINWTVYKQGYKPIWAWVIFSAWYKYYKTQRNFSHAFTMSTFYSCVVCNVHVRPRQEALQCDQSTSLFQNCRKRLNYYQSSVRWCQKRSYKEPNVNTPDCSSVNYSSCGTSMLPPKSLPASSRGSVQTFTHLQPSLC